MTAMLLHCTLRRQKKENLSWFTLFCILIQLFMIKEPRKVLNFIHKHIMYHMYLSLNIHCGTMFPYIKQYMQTPGTFLPRFYISIMSLLLSAAYFIYLNFSLAGSLVQKKGARKNQKGGFAVMP